MIYLSRSPVAHVNKMLVYTTMNLSYKELNFKTHFSVICSVFLDLDINFTCSVANPVVASKQTSVFFSFVLLLQYIICQ